MEQIKLEVGRFYQVRNPERAKHKGRDVVVKIIGKEQPSYPFRGDNGELYREDGRIYVGLDSPYDLVREVTP